MPRRAGEPADPVTISFDGKAITASRGEPVAAALLASGVHAFARSPKFHRPRGPSCMRGGCDGCLARVDGQPNVATCMLPAEAGMVVESQNTLGSRSVDLLRANDWFFHEGMNHHEMFAGIPGAERLMLALAVRVAGLGKIPSSAGVMKQAVRRTIDAFVVGSGPAGMAIALELEGKGRAVEIVDDGPAPGGSARALGDDEGFVALRERFHDAASKGRLRLRQRCLAVSFYERELLIVGGPETELVTARDVVLATGAHDGVVAFEGNDLPGTLSARAASLLLSHGVLIGDAPVVCVEPGGGPFGEAFAAAARKRDGVRVTMLHGTPLRAQGRSRVKKVVVRRIEGAEETLDADALVIDAPRSPAYELPAQAGATLRHEARGYVPVTARGNVREGVWVTGEVAGTSLEAQAILRDARDLAHQIA